MKTFSVRKIASMCSLISLFLLNSCNKEKDLISNKENEITTLTNFLKYDNGCERKVLYQNGYFIIEDDILISKEAVLSNYNRNINSKNARPNQYRFDYIVRDEFLNNMFIYLDPGLPNEWKIAASQAVSNFNNNTKLKFYFTYDSDLADIKVSSGLPNDGPYGAGEYPYGRPGSSIKLNINASIPAEGKTAIFIHELGHNIGLCHTDEGPSQNCHFINGTPTTDPQSVMNQYYGTGGLTLSQGDITAIGILYPNNVASLPFAQIDLVNSVSTYPDQNGGQHTTADMYIKLTDVNGNPVNANIGSVGYKDLSTGQRYNSPYVNSSYTYVGNVVLTDVNCPSPGNCSGNNYTYYVTPSTGRYYIAKNP